LGWNKYLVYLIYFMFLLSSGRRGDVFLEEVNWVKYAIKKAKDNSKKWALQKEITILKFLKWKINFVPQILEYWEDFFKYKFIEWKTLNKVKNPSKNIYRQLLKYAYLLDKLEVEHWELSKPTKNIIISPDEKVYIIDFERWNMYNTKFKNMRGYSQFLAKAWFITFKELKKNMKYADIEKIYDGIKNALS